MHSAFLKSLILVLPVVIGLAACNSEQNKTRPTDIPQEITIQVDSNLIDQIWQTTGRKDTSWVAQAKIIYHNQKNYTLWFNREEIYPYTNQLLKRVQSAIIEGADTTGWNINRLQMAIKDQRTPGLDIALTRLYFHYADFLAHGIVPKEDVPFRWDIPRRQVHLGDALTGILSNDEPDPFTRLEPKYMGFQALRKELYRQDSLAKTEGFTIVPVSDKIRPGDHHSNIPKIRERLLWEGLIDPLPDSLMQSSYFDSVLVKQITQYQHDYGLIDDGVIGAQTYEMLNTSPEERMDQLRIAMEEAKWLPDSLGERYVMANIPAFTVYAVSGNDSLIMKCIVGRVSQQTPVFADEFEYVIFRPYWNVPHSISGNEILPALKRDMTYLDRENMEILVGNTPVTLTAEEIAGMTSSEFVSRYRVRQRPGTFNALGTVKFIFPNKHQVYMHDTNGKYLFKKDDRALSHGCVRLEEPNAFTRYLLTDHEKWTPESVDTARFKGGENKVILPKEERVPVYIVYFTAWGDPAGKVHFRRDIYKRDQLLKRVMNGEELSVEIKDRVVQEG